MCASKRASKQKRTCRWPNNKPIYHLAYTYAWSISQWGLPGVVNSNRHRVTADNEHRCSWTLWERDSRLCLAVCNALTTASLYSTAKDDAISVANSLLRREHFFGGAENILTGSTTSIHLPLSESFLSWEMKLLIWEKNCSLLSCCAALCGEYSTRAITFTVATRRPN